MLPSGNDAAYLIAQVGGSILILIEGGLKKAVYIPLLLERELAKGRNHVIKYIQEMNKLAREISMKNSKWSNPHGLSNR